MSTQCWECFHRLYTLTWRCVYSGRALPLCRVVVSFILLIKSLHTPIHMSFLLTVILAIEFFQKIVKNKKDEWNHAVAEVCTPSCNLDVAVLRMNQSHPKVWSLGDIAAISNDPWLTENRCLSRFSWPFALLSIRDAKVLYLTAISNRSYVLPICWGVTAEEKRMVFMMLH